MYSIAVLDRQVEDQLTEKVLKENWDGLTGTTVCVALIEGNHLYIANLGDSGAILCRNGECLKLSYPHIPKNELEYKRVIQAGGIIQVSCERSDILTVVLE